MGDKFYQYYKEFAEDWFSELSEYEQNVFLVFYGYLPGAGETNGQLFDKISGKLLYEFRWFIPENMEEVLYKNNDWNEKKAFQYVFDTCLDMDFYNPLRNSDIFTAFNELMAEHCEDYNEDPKQYFIDVQSMTQSAGHLPGWINYDDECTEFYEEHQADMSAYEAYIEASNSPYASLFDNLTTRKVNKYKRKCQACYICYVIEMSECLFAKGQS